MKNAYTKALAKIHIAAKAVGWVKEGDLVQGEAYRDMLARVTGKLSTAGMSASEHTQILDEMKRLGWKPKAPKKKKGDWRAPRIRYIKGMWKQLGGLSALRNPTNDGLLQFCKQHMTAEKLEWASSAELNKIVETLKAWVARETR